MMKAVPTPPPGATALKLKLCLLLVILTLPALIACGPDATTAPADGNGLTAVADSGRDPDTPTATPKPTQNYLKLHPVLRQLAQTHEAGYATENQAAAQAPLFYDRTVLVTADVPSNIDAVDEWMASQNIEPRHTETRHLESSLLYAYVPVSLLGVLSRQAEVSWVKPVVPPWMTISEWVKDGPNLQMSLPGTPTPTPAPDNPIPPKFPYWMKDMRFGEFRGPVRESVYRYEDGYLTEAEAAALADFYQGALVMVDAALTENSQAPDWLRSKGVTISSNVGTPASPHHQTDYVPIWWLDGYVPVSLLKPLAARSDVIYIDSQFRPAFGPMYPEASKECAPVDFNIFSFILNWWLEDEKC